MTLKEQLWEVERQHFEGLDWNKSNDALAAETGFSYATINHWRKVLGKPRVTKWFPACQAWDWTKRNVELAAEHRLSPTQVGQYRAQCGQPMVPRITARPAFAVKPQPMHVDWPSLDWAKNDIQLALEVKRTRELVRQWRAKLGKPPSPHKWRQRKFIAFAEKFKGRASLTHKEVKEVMPVSDETIRNYCAQLGIPLTPLTPRCYALYPWGEMNFQIPNLLLADIWQADSGTIANHRSRYMCPSSLFVCVKGRIPELFKALVESERTKAAEYFAKEQPPLKPRREPIEQ